MPPHYKIILMQKILVVSHDKVGQKMAGPGMRYHQIATELSKDNYVTLATFNPAHLENVGNVTYQYKDIKVYDFQNDFLAVDTIIAMWLSEEMIQFAKKHNIRLVFDLYTPVPVEDLVAKVFAKKISADEAYNYAVSLEHYKTILQNGDFFLCSNEIQKDFWVGFAFSSGAVSPNNYGEFPLFDRIQTLPMGINLDELKQSHDTSLLTKRIPEIKDKDFVIVWTGGIWDWFDAVTPIKAVKRLHDSGFTHIKLVFMGTRHPNTDVPDMDETSLAYKTAKQLGIYNKGVFFLEGWLEYDKRLSYLLRANIALYAHKPSIEARYSHRTRVLDHILSCLPTIATKGDYLADIIQENGYGTAIPPNDIDAMVEAITSLATNHTKLDRMKDLIRSDQYKYTWSKQMENLKKYLSNNSSVRKSYSLPDTRTLNKTGKQVARIKKMVPSNVKRFIKRRMR